MINPSQLVVRLTKSAIQAAALQSALESTLTTLDKNNANNIRTMYGLLRGFCAEVQSSLVNVRSLQELGIPNSINLRQLTPHKVTNLLQSVANCRPIGVLPVIKPKDNNAELKSHSWNTICNSRWCPWCHYRRFVEIYRLLEKTTGQLSYRVITKEGIGAYIPNTKTNKTTSWSAYISRIIRRSVDLKSALLFTRQDFNYGLIHKKRAVTTTIILEDCQNYLFRVHPDDSSPSLQDQVAVVRDKQLFLNTILPTLYYFPPICVPEYGFSNTFITYLLGEHSTNHFTHLTKNKKI